MRTIGNVAVLLAVCLVVVQCGPWTENENLQRAAADRKPIPLKTYILNLDLAPEDRWTSIALEFKNQTQVMLDYLQQYIPKWLEPELEFALAKVVKYRGWGDEYRREMEGLSKTLDIPLGYAVMANLVYQLESIGINCSAWNTTGPCNGEVIFPFQRQQQEEGPLGFCTSVVAQDENGVIFHGRNLDWNVPLALRSLMMNVDYRRNNQTVFIGTSILGFVGILNGMKPGAFSYSMNARGRGGSIIVNVLDMLAEGSATPSQAARTALEKMGSYDEAVEYLAKTPLINEIYYTVGGIKAGEGAIITRNRNSAADIWRLNNTADGWYRLETNYDHWEPVPVMDDRRTPGYAHMEQMGQSGVNAENMMTVMTTWPTFNHHTDETAVYSAALNYYNAVTFDDGSN